MSEHDDTPALETFDGLPSCEGAPGPIELDGRLLTSSCGSAALFDASTDIWTPVDLGDLYPEPQHAAWTGTEVLSWGQTCCHGTGGAPFQPNVAWRHTPPGR
ncbi:MAG: hypothetical protein ABIP36_06100 [Acidimicrobiales bacterium]